MGRIFPAREEQFHDAAHFRQAVKPRDDLITRFAVFEAAVQLVTNKRGQPRNFAEACIHTFNYVFMRVRIAEARGRALRTVLNLDDVGRHGKRGIQPGIESWMWEH